MFIPRGAEEGVPPAGKLAAADKGLGEGLCSEHILCLKEPHRELVGARDGDAGGQLALQLDVRQGGVLEYVRVVQHIVGDHVGELALFRIAVGIDPVVHALDLGGVGAVVGELVQPDEFRHGLEGKMIHHKARQSNGGQRRAAHGHRKHHGKAPVAELDGGVLFQAVGQCGGTNEEQQQPPRHEQQHLVGAGVLYPGKQHKAHQQLCPCKAGQGRQTAFCGKPQPHSDEDEVQQTDAQCLCGQLQRDAAEVVVRVAPGVVKA